MIQCVVFFNVIYIFFYPSTCFLLRCWHASYRVFTATSVSAENWYKRSMAYPKFAVLLRTRTRTRRKAIHPLSNYTEAWLRTLHRDPFGSMLESTEFTSMGETYFYLFSFLLGYRIWTHIICDKANWTKEDTHDLAVFYLFHIYYCLIVLMSRGPVIQY